MEQQGKAVEQQGKAVEQQGKAVKQQGKAVKQHNERQSTGGLWRPTSLYEFEVAMACRRPSVSAASCRAARKGSVLAAKAVEHTRQRQCLSREGSGNTQGNGSVLAAKAVEAHKAKAVLHLFILP